MRAPATLFSKIWDGLSLRDRANLWRHLPDRLPIVLPAATVELAKEAECGDAAAGREFTVDLTQQIITAPSGQQVPFRVDGAKRRALLEGLEEIHMTLTLAGEIAGFQDSDRRRRPWIYRF
jgi:3-isopropylmalate/(R)-2-methylmalate dehydratase small subunit